MPAPTQPPPEARLLFRVEEVAEMLAIKRSMLYRLLSAGVIPTVHIGRSVRISRAALDRLIAQVEEDPELLRNI